MRRLERENNGESLMKNIDVNAAIIKRLIDERRYAGKTTVNEAVTAWLIRIEADGLCNRNCSCSIDDQTLGMCLKPECLPAKYCDFALRPMRETTRYTRLPL